MLPLTEIEKYYPENLRGFKRFILREYLQHKILQIVFDSEFANRLCFLGGTCLRIVHGNNRFSEDLDFDNFGMEESEFQKVAQTIERELEKEGYQVEMKTILKSAFHCHIRFPELLYKEGLSGHLEEKILIQLDMNEMGRDVAAFLFNPADVRKVIHFPEYIEQVKLR